MTVAPVRGIVFDKDGTLFDFATTWEAWAAAFLMRAAGAFGTYFTGLALGGFLLFTIAA